MLCNILNIYYVIYLTYCIFVIHYIVYMCVFILNKRSYIFKYDNNFMKY